MLLQHAKIFPPGVPVADPCSRQPLEMERTRRSEVVVFRDRRLLEALDACRRQAGEGPAEFKPWPTTPRSSIALSGFVRHSGRWRAPFAVAAAALGSAMTGLPSGHTAAVAAAGSALGSALLVTVTPLTREFFQVQWTGARQRLELAGLDEPLGRALARTGLDGPFALRVPYELAVAAGHAMLAAPIGAAVLATSNVSSFDPKPTLRDAALGAAAVSGIFTAVFLVLRACVWLSVPGAGRDQPAGDAGPRATVSESSEHPAFLRCPLSGGLLENPVSISVGQGDIVTYERDALLAELTRQSAQGRRLTDPVSGRPIEMIPGRPGDDPSHVLLLNHPMLRNVLNDYRRKMELGEAPQVVALGAPSAGEPAACPDHDRRPADPTAAPPAEVNTPSPGRPFWLELLEPTRMIARPDEAQWFLPLSAGTAALGARMLGRAAALGAAEVALGASLLPYAFVGDAARPMITDALVQAASRYPAHRSLILDVGLPGVHMLVLPLMGSLLGGAIGGAILDAGASTGGAAAQAAAGAVSGAAVALCGPLLVAIAFGYFLYPREEWSTFVRDRPELIA